MGEAPHASDNVSDVSVKLLPGQKVAVKVLHPSGEVALDAELAASSTIWQLQNHLSKESPNQLAFLQGEQVLARHKKLQDLGVEPLCVVRKARKLVSPWAPPQEMSNIMKLQKCIILGEAFAGKTQFLRAICGDSFSKDPSASCGLDFRVLHVEHEDRKVKLKIWSARGMEALPACFRTTFFESAEGYFAVFSLAKRDTFEKLRDLVSHFNQEVPDELAQHCRCLVGTHKDLAREVREEEVLQLAEEMQCPYHEVCNKSREGVDDAWITWLDQYFTMYEDVGAETDEPAYPAEESS